MKICPALEIIANCSLDRKVTVTDRALNLTERANLITFGFDSNCNIFLQVAQLLFRHGWTLQQARLDAAKKDGCYRYP
jgi:hypothetical protein